MVGKKIISSQSPICYCLTNLQSNFLLLPLVKMSGQFYQIGPKRARNQIRNSFGRLKPNPNRQARQEECHIRFLARQAEIAAQAEQVSVAQQAAQAQHAVLATRWLIIIFKPLKKRKFWFQVSNFRQKYHLKNLTFLGWKDKILSCRVFSKKDDERCHYESVRNGKW